MDSQQSVTESASSVPSPFPENGRGTAKPRKKTGAPARNQNAVVHGLRSLATTGRVPTTIKGGLYIRRQTRKLRREACAAFVALHDREPGVHEHIVLKVLARAEARAMLHERILAERWNDLTFEQQALALDKIGSAGDQLIRCSRELGLNKQLNDDPWKSIHAAVLDATPGTPAVDAGECDPAIPDEAPAESVQ